MNCIQLYRLELVDDFGYGPSFIVLLLPEPLYLCPNHAFSAKSRVTFMAGAELAPLALAGRLALALALAVFLGLAFEEVYKREERSAPGGVRTFPMLALSGAMLYLIEPRQALAFIVGLMALAIWLRAFLHNEPASTTTTSLMIPTTNLVAYLIGPVALTQPPWLVVGVSVTAVLLLGTREELHRLIRVVPQDELLTAGKFLILVGIILPLVPDQPVTTVTPLTPYQVWLAVVAICTLSYLTYLLLKYASARNITLLPAILGGIYSSTATTIVLAKRQREAGVARPELAAGILAATAVMYLRLGVVVALFDLRFALALAPALGALFTVGAALAAYEWRRTGCSRPMRTFGFPRSIHCRYRRRSLLLRSSSSSPSLPHGFARLSVRPVFSLWQRSLELLTSIHS